MLKPDEMRNRHILTITN